MNINPVYFNHISKLGASVVQKPSGAAEMAAVGQSSQQIQDTITISRQGSSQNLFSGLARRIANDVAQLDSPARVEELKSAVQAGNYHVPSADVAAAMLNFRNDV